MQVEKAANVITESLDRIHALVIYSDMMKLREFWSLYIKKCVEEKNEVVYIAPFYETVDTVRKLLSEGPVSIDIQKYETDKKSLIIVDSLEKYLDKNAKEFNVMSLLKANEDLVEYAEGELKKKGVSFLGDSGAFLFKNQIQSLLDYEASLPRQFEINLKGICLYHVKDFDRLSMDQKEQVIKQHKIAVKI